MDSLQSGDGETLSSRSANIDGNSKMSQVDMSIILRDFEHYIDNMPNPLFTQTLTSTPMAFDQYGIKIKSKTPQPQTAKALPRKSVERIGLRLMAKG